MEAGGGLPPPGCLSISGVHDCTGSGTPPVLCVADMVLSGGVCSFFSDIVLSGGGMLFSQNHLFTSWACRVLGYALFYVH